MPQERTIPTDVMAELERDSSPDALIWFLTISHPSLSESIRVVSDIFDYVLDGNTYIGFPFDAIPVTDDDQQPSAQLRVQNIDRRIGHALESLEGRAEIEAAAYSTADFNLNLDPREATGTPTVVYRFANFALTDTEVNAADITGKISLATDYTQEPWPYIRATQARFRGLFR